MGIRSVPEPPRPTPKALCPACNRPLPMLRAGKCLYCGEVLVPEAVSSGPALPPEVLLALEGPRKETGKNRWTIRLLALGIVSVLLSAWAASCMKM